MQSGGRRGNGTPFAAEDRLVALAVGLCVGAADVRRQGNVADAVENGEEILHRIEAQHPCAEFAALDDLGPQRDLAVRRGENQNLTEGDFPARPDQCAPEIFARSQLSFVVSHPFR